MLKEIPQKANHIIKGFKEIKPINGDLPILYEPVYKRVIPLNKVYWDYSRDERIYLISDTQGITCEGQFVEVDTEGSFQLVDPADREMFFKLLANNGYQIKDGKLMIFPNYGNVYMTAMGIIVIYLANRYHTCTNEIVNYQITRRADEFEIEAFFASLKGNGFTYHPVNKCITESERYYYFPSYSLYNGFQPEKKKWIDSDADKFYEEHSEVFDTFNECAFWCDVINKTLRRNYPEVKLEE